MSCRVKSNDRTSSNLSTKGKQNEVKIPIRKRERFRVKGEGTIYRQKTKQKWRKENETVYEDMDHGEAIYQTLRKL